MAFVLDASIVLAWLLPDEDSEAAQRIVTRLATESAQAPSLLHFEVSNALLQAGRRERISAALRAEMRAAFFALPVAIDSPDASALERSDAIAARHALSIYDASYLELAARRGIALATFDAALARAARAESVDLL